MSERPIEWAALTIAPSKLLDAFASYCAQTEELEVVEQSPTLLRVAWKRERSAVALTDAIEERDEPLLALTELSDELVSRFLDDGALRSRVAVYDLHRLEKINAVRSSVFVHFEWFLRDTYRVKLMPSPAFTQGLVDRGIISLGMG